MEKLHDVHKDPNGSSPSFGKGVFSEEVAGLFQRHFDQLHIESGISVEVIRERGYRTVINRNALNDLGFSQSQQRTPTILIPIHTPDGAQPFCIHRPDIPRVNSKGKSIKYENPAGNGIRLDVPPRCRKDLGNPNVRLWVTEGIKKSDALASHGECVVDLLGVWGFKHKNAFRSTTVSADLDYLALEGREVYICYDSDVMVKVEVRKALDVFTEHLKRKRAIVFHVFLPGDNGKKKGVDEYLSGHSIDDLLSHAVKQEVSSQLYDTVQKYDFVDGHLCRYQRARDGDALIPVRLANFNAGIIREMVFDNGLETTRFYEIKAKTLQKDLGTLTVPAASFASMGWVAQLGSEAILEPGTSVKDYVRHYIQINSKPQQVTVLTFTGWRKNGDDWIYLSSNGAIGQKDIPVQLPQELERYALPFKPENEADAIKASFSFLDIGDPKVTFPLFTYTYLAPMTTLLSPLPNFSLYPYGQTGVFKSTLALLMLSHFGSFSSLQDLDNFESTPNALERRAFTLKDSLMVLDDFHPSPQHYLAQQKESTAQRLIREFSNRTGRGRLNADATEKPRYSPRGCLVITGEEIPSLQSTLARTYIVEMKKGDIDIDKLTEIQAKVHLFPHAMASFLNWMIAKGIENIQSAFRDIFPKLRSKALSSDVHPKLLEQVAFLQFSMITVLSWLTDKGIITDSKAKELMEEGSTIFRELAANNYRWIQGEEPVGKFVDTLNSLIVQGKVKIVDKDYEADFLGGEAADLIGFFDREHFYLLPGLLWNAVKKFWNQSGEHFPVSKNTFFKMLIDKKVVEVHNGSYRQSLRIKDKVHSIMKVIRDEVEGKNEEM